LAGVDRGSTTALADRPGEVLTVLPSPVGSKTMLAAARRFHVRLSSAGRTLHLARIAALDSAVCGVLSGLLRNGSTLGRDPVIRAARHRIYRD